MIASIALRLQNQVAFSGSQIYFMAKLHLPLTFDDNIGMQFII